MHLQDKGVYCRVNDKSAWLEGMKRGQAGHFRAYNDKSAIKLGSPSTTPRKLFQSPNSCCEGNEAEQFKIGEPSNDLSLKSARKTSCLEVNQEEKEEIPGGC